MHTAEPNGFWRDRPTLVTGASGLLGSWLTRRLLDAGAEVTCLVRDGARTEALRSGRGGDRLQLEFGDISDGVTLQRALSERRIDTVFHLAAQAIVTVANRDPLPTFETNIRGTWLLLEACRTTASVRQIVLASSDKAYGSAPVLPYTEDTPLRGEHPYEVSKSCADLIAQAYARTYSLPVAITRCGNFYGGGDFNWSRIVPGTIRAVYEGRAPVIRTDGKLIRDYLHVEDGAAANMLLAERLATSPELAGQAFNFSTEEPLTVLTLVERIVSLMGGPLPARVLGEPHSEIAEQSLDAARARSLLGWRALHSLDQGLQLTIDWYCHYLAQHKPKTIPPRKSPSVPPPARVSAPK